MQLASESVEKDKSSKRNMQFNFSQKFIQFEPIQNEYPNESDSEELL